MDNTVAIQRACKSFGKTVALDGVTFTIGKGERLALIGPNGAGKTTLIRAIAGRCRLDQGDVKLFNQPADQATRARLGFVPQDLAVHALLTAEENLRFFGRLQGVPRRVLQARIDHALEWTGLESRRNDLVKTFSGGMKRRLNIACGVLHEPEVVLLDEPTVGVDPQSRERIHDMLFDLHQRGVALLLTTHMMEEAERSMDRIVIQDHGKIIADGSAAELVSSSFGDCRTIRLTLDNEPKEPLPAPWMSSGREVTRGINHVTEVSSLLSEIAALGYEPKSLVVDTPSLQEVFIKLTGRELRE